MNCPICDQDEWSKVGVHGLFFLSRNDRPVYYFRMTFEGPPNRWCVRCRPDTLAVLDLYRIVIQMAITLVGQKDSECDLYKMQLLFCGDSRSPVVTREQFELDTRIYDGRRHTGVSFLK